MVLLGETSEVSPLLGVSGVQNGARAPMCGLNFNLSSNKLVKIYTSHLCMWFNLVRFVFRKYLTLQYSGANSVLFSFSVVQMNTAHQ